MNEVVALILAGGRVNELSILTMHRPKSAIPFGGMYRVIDFALSNLMHSGIERVGILSQFRSGSLIRHIGIGSSWDMTGRDRGATMLPPTKGIADTDWYRGTADAVYQNLEFLERHGPELVLILSGDHIYRMDYGPMIEYHRRKEADLTIAFTETPIDQAHRFGLGRLDDEDGPIGGRLVDYVEKPERPTYTAASMTVYLFRAGLLAHLVTENARHGEGWEFGRDILPRMLGRHRVYGWRHRGYWGYTRTVDEFWQCHMELLGERPRIDLEGWGVRTNLDHFGLRDRSPALLLSGSTVEDARISPGCRVSGTVRNSVLFPGCRVARGAVVEHSILFPDVHVERDAVLDRVIADIGVTVGPGARVGDGDDDRPNRSVPELLRSGITLVGKMTQLPGGVRIGRNCIVGPYFGPERFTEQTYSSGETIG
ncbi:MAG: glucose-1-phosphate adenylyltransferase [Candidatus Eisenbacteria bacterium]|nr:glucose-1-phosphate adenylyltransferase [Candidatus Eisenbacteria bacterium]